MTEEANWRQSTCPSWTYRGMHMTYSTSNSSCNPKKRGHCKETDFMNGLMEFGMNSILPDLAVEEARHAS